MNIFNLPKHLGKDTEEIHNSKGAQNDKLVTYISPHYNCLFRSKQISVYYKLSVINIATIVMCFMYTTEDNH